VVGCSYLGLPESLGVVCDPIGASMSPRTRLTLGIGGFDAGVGRVGSRPLGWEGTELTIRLPAGRQGSAALYVPSTVIDHHVGQERLRFTYFLRRSWHEGTKTALVRLVGSSADWSANDVWPP
jgi:glucosyl-dolichyl phosphate glucuronosyltransferase